MTLAVPPGNQRVVLAVLLLNAGRVMTLEKIAETLWGAAPPASARVTVRNYVKRLRKALGHVGRDRIVTRPGGYLASVDAAELDVSRFESLLGSARSAVRDGSWRRAAAQARAALALWRGEPLADVGSEALTAREAARLTEMRLQALEVRVEADLHLGLHAEVIAELRRLAAVHPFRERLHALLMLSLYADGRQAEALAAYQQTRRVLVRELGSEPGAELRRLHQQVLTADPTLAVPGIAPVSSPRPVVPRQLPGTTAHFSGRSRELNALSALLDRAGQDGQGSVVISAVEGTAGVGKTALALHWAHQVAGRFPDGQLYVNLRGFGSAGPPVEPADVIRRFLDALGIPADRLPPSPEGREDLYRSMVAGRRMLILLDNASDGAQVRPLLPGGPGCLVVVTSRSQLLGLVAHQGARPLTLNVLSEADAGVLLARRLGPERITEESAAVAELTALCAGLPLALAISAARAVLQPRLSLASLAAEMRDGRGRLDALDTGEAAGSVRAVFSWSYRRLSPPAARMFRLLGVQLGPDITAPAAASLAGVPRPRASELLGELTRAHLLTSHAPGRFACHDLLRTYAGERAEVEEDAATRREAAWRVLDHYLHTAHAADRMLAPTREPLALGPLRTGAVPEVFSYYEQALAWFRAEHHVLMAGATLAGEIGLDAYACQIPWSLVTFFDLDGHWHDGVTVQRVALATAERLADRAAQARAHRGLSAALIQLNRVGDAQAHLHRALRLYAQICDRVGQARVNLDLARVAGQQGGSRRALRHAEQALGLLQAADHRAGEGRALNSIGWYQAQLGHHEQALAPCSQAVRLCGELDDRLGEAAAWDSLGYAHRHLGGHQEAIACYRRAIDLTDQLGARFHQADALIHLGDAYQAAGRTWSAREAWQQALAILDDLDHPGAGQLRANIGGLETAGRN